MTNTKKEEKLKQRYISMAEIEHSLHSAGYALVAGTDEAGRGPLAGPVYAAAVILDPNAPIYGLNDSKKLSEKKRLELATEIKAKAIAYAIVKRDNLYIDQHNILVATEACMTEALLSLNPGPDYILTDAVKLKYFPEDKQLNLVKGDAKTNVIAAASILAKTARDAEMVKWNSVYPEYAFAQNKGYGTKKHYEALDNFGPTKIHRQSFLKTWYERRKNNG